MSTDHPIFMLSTMNTRRWSVLTTLLLTEGRLPPRVLGLVVEWAARHRAELLENWDAIEDQRPLRKIEPLD